MRLVLLPALLAILVGAPPALAWTWPVDGSVLQPFVLGGDPYAADQHRGIDVSALEGAPVRAPVSGTVTFAGSVPSGGRTITIETPDGYAVTLLHLGATLVAEGDTIAEGDGVGVAGWSGAPEHAAPSVHLGVRIAAQPTGYLDPLSFLPPRAPSAVVADARPDEQAVTPPDAVGDDGAAAPAVEVSALPPEPDVVEPSPEPPPQEAQPARAEPLLAEAPLLAPPPAVTVSGPAPQEASQPSADAAAPEHPGEAPAEPAETALVGAEAAPPAAAPSSHGAAWPAETAAARSSGASVSRPAAGREELRTRAGRREPDGRPRRVRSDRRLEPFADSRPPAARSGVRPVEPEVSGRSNAVREPPQDAGSEPEAGAQAWLAYGGLAAILAALAAVLSVIRRRGRGGQGAGGGAAPRLTPPLAAQGAGPVLDRPAPAAAPRRDSPRFRRRLDRGGPGGPAVRPAAPVGRRRASV